MRPYSRTVTAAVLFVGSLAAMPVVWNSAHAATPSGDTSPYYYRPQKKKSDRSRGWSQHGDNAVMRYLSCRWREGQSLALLEQTVEDHNAELVATAVDAISAISRRRLIVLPLDERLFDPPMGVFSHGHVQTGDKMSLPKEFWLAIQKSLAEVPWLFEVSRVSGVTTPPFPTATTIATTEGESKTHCLDKVVGGAIDFRSPANYVFLPHWMMRALSLRPRDVVDVRLVTNVPPGSIVKLRPHSKEFLRIHDHRAVLETELKHYSALTRGSTIPFDYNGKRFYFDVIDLQSTSNTNRGGGTKKVEMAKVQDCDIVAEFVRPKKRS